LLLRWPVIEREMIRWEWGVARTNLGVSFDQEQGFFSRSASSSNQTKRWPPLCPLVSHITFVGMAEIIKSLSKNNKTELARSN
jgi:hypothetical protein